ncbi:MAG: BatA domain-containing protein, partial [Calditrichia bacterium]|nr:BatA domain-containing protein [Calditrichia bacterium]
MLEFYSPYYLLFLILIPFFILYEEKRKRKLSAKIVISDENLFQGIKPTFRTIVNRFFYIFKIVIFVLIVFALA